jgi:hypothetical protein
MVWGAVLLRSRFAALALVMWRSDATRWATVKVEDLVPAEPAWSDQRTH